MIPPRIETCPPQPAARAARPACAGLVVLLFAAVAVLYCFDPSGHTFYPRCAFKAWSGLDCPGCGGLRAAHALLHGDIATALARNPLVVLLAGGAFLWGAIRVARGARAGAALMDWLTCPWVVGTTGVLLILFTLARNLACSPLSPLAGF
jgi:hypothetical protein